MDLKKELTDIQITVNSKEFQALIEEIKRFAVMNPNKKNIPIPVSKMLSGYSDTLKHYGLEVNHQYDIDEDCYIISW